METTHTIPVSYVLLLVLPHKGFTVLPKVLWEKVLFQLETGALMLESVKAILKCTHLV